MEKTFYSTPKQLADILYSGEYETRDALYEAFDFAKEMADLCEHPEAVIAAVQVVVNTIAVQIMQMESTK